jgi:hypothetical protein
MNIPKIEKNGKFLFIDENENNFENKKNLKFLKNEKNEKSGNSRKNRKERGNSIGSHNNDKIIKENNDISECIGNDNNDDNYKKNDQDNEYTVQLLFIEKESLCPYLPSVKKNLSNVNRNFKKKMNSNIVINNNIVPLINSINGNYIYIYICIYVCMYVLLYVFIYMYVYIYIYMNF